MWWWQTSLERCGSAQSVSFGQEIADWHWSDYQNTLNIWCMSSGAVGDVPVGRGSRCQVFDKNSPAITGYHRLLPRLISSVSPWFRASAGYLRPETARPRQLTNRFDPLNLGVIHDLICNADQRIDLTYPFLSFFQGNPSFSSCSFWILLVDRYFCSAFSFQPLMFSCQSRIFSHSMPQLTMLNS